MLEVWGQLQTHALPGVLENMGAEVSFFPYQYLKPFINFFLVLQVRRLQSLVDDLESDNELLKRRVEQMRKRQKD